MTYAMKPLGCDPVQIRGISERMIISHFVEAVRWANADRLLAELTAAPVGAGNP
jgi:hypothetical protein